MKNIYAWLIENGKDGADIRYVCFKEGASYWTADPYNAIWLSRRKDAESLAEENEDAWRIVEHCFQLK